MKYQQIYGPLVFHPTGYVGNCNASLKSGQRLLDEFDGAPLDAPEVIPAGATCCIEWDGNPWGNHRGVRLWFAAPVISLRTYQ
jgi:hypothetical protein